MNPVRAVIAAIGCVLLLWWGASQLQMAGGLQRWADAKTLADRLPFSSGQLSSQQLTDRAVARMDTLFPPDWKGAKEDADAAVAKDPFRSQDWMILARAQIFSGESDAARLSIRRADALDPWYPLQRLHSAQLWSLLGEDAHAEELARSVATMGKPYREQAAAELVRLGLGAERVFGIVKSSDDTPEEEAELLQQFPNTEGPALHSIYESLPPDWKSNSAYRATLFDRFSDPFDYDVLRELLVADGRELSETAAAITIDGTLVKPPFASLLEIGWLPVPDKLGAQAAWLSPQVTPGGETGEVRLSFGRPLAGKDPGARYAFYRFPARQGVGVGVTVTLRSANTRVVHVIIEARKDAAVWRSDRVDVSSSPLDVRFTVDNIAADGLVDLVIDARIDEQGEGDTALLMGPLRIDPVRVRAAQ